MSNFKLRVCMALVLVFTLALFTGCAPNLTAIKVDSAVPLIKGDTYSLTLTPSFEEDLSEEDFAAAAEKLTPTFASSDEEVVTVDSNGLITAVNGGEATITVTLGEFSASCAVTVSVPIEGISTTDTINLETNGKNTATLEVDFSPTDTTEKEVTFSSDKEDVATVDKNGVVTAVSKGTAVITATCKDANAVTNVTVTVKVTDIALKSDSGWIYVGGTYRIVASTVPEDADAATYTYESNNTSVATVNATGLITGKAVGSAKISVTGAGFTKTYTITVKAKPVVTVPSGGATTPSGGSAAAGGAVDAGGATTPSGGDSGGGGAAPALPPEVNTSPIGGLDPDAGNDMDGTFS